MSREKYTGRWSFVVRPSEQNRLRDFADKYDLTASEVIRAAVNKYILLTDPELFDKYTDNPKTLNLHQN